MNGIAPERTAAASPRVDQVGVPGAPVEDAVAQNRHGDGGGTKS